MSDFIAATTRREMREKYERLRSERFSNAYATWSAGFGFIDNRRRHFFEFLHIAAIERRAVAGLKSGIRRIEAKAAALENLRRARETRTGKMRS